MQVSEQRHMYTALMKRRSLAVSNFQREIVERFIITSYGLRTTSACEGLMIMTDIVHKPARVQHNYITA